MKTYAEIIVNSDVLDIDKPFTYEVTEEFKDHIRQGQLVKVPFGVRNTLTDGFVLGLKYEDDIKGMRIKKVKKISFIEPVLTSDDLSLIEFLRDTYLCKYIDAIRLLIPQGILKGTKNKSKKVIIWIKDIQDKNKEEKYGEILNYIKANDGKFTKSELTKEKNLSLYKINKLIEEEYLGCQEEIVYRYNIREYKAYGEKKLTDEQFMAIEQIKASKNNLYLLKGVTGSGKTEVYMKLVEETIKNGNSAIVLVPEIALTPQMIERFKGRFGKEVALFHSRLSEGERHDEWHRVHDGNAKLIVGARSALFLPARNLGLIIIDEEHENTYKSEQNPKYQTREVAEFLSRLKGCKVIFGSATPSIESYYRAISGEMKLIELNKRVDKKPMPKMQIVDMRNELKSGNMSIFSKELYNSVNEALKNKEQIILFLNRRGFSTFVSCRGCGYVFKCPNCDISMTYHKNGFLVCHYCGKTEKQPKICPKCESKYVKFFGSGTQKVQDEVVKYFPSARVLRMDVDTTRGKNAHENIYNSFKNGEGDILIGTQMISKGLDFPNVTLVGIIAADISINIPDYRSAEKTFQIITQVGGRAGRGEKEGKVIIQTYTPDYYGLIYAKNYDYEGFYNEEFALRGLMGYPPFGKLLLINGSSKNEEQLKVFMKNLAIELKKINNEYTYINMLGPVPCIITKIKDSYRWQILFKGELPQEFCKKIKDRLYEFNKNVYNEIRVSIDINPNNLT
ncbi:primosomal protein N' [Clostridium gasigenes]|uniref:Replication restart protein PriA n=1 Tax=Clostridium gasigenes TaxID=94869 RepID=A0A1H0RC21_9CLOT|nr:primosomal protein N' [Clostridium gasigenes]MBB6623018.1 primosomal protein N' [Clostridium gasigenes]MBU3087788.1 primosomal protein N' [Clostridium gasigenes]SDP26955.1 replication restart DNA helicase PriA [Clostridium gasigenes]